MTDRGKPERSVTFDLDGTLIDSPFDRFVFSWLDEAFAKRGIDGARSLFRAEQLRRFAQGRRREGFDWDDIVRKVASLRGIRWDVSLCEVMAGPLCEALRAFPPYPDAPAALAALIDDGFSLFAVSNGYACYQRLTLDLMGLGGYFAATLGPDTIGCAKPDPRVFAAPELRLPVVAHVGDLLTQDVAAARLAGIRTVLVIRSQGAEPGFAFCAPLDPQERPRALFDAGWLAAQFAREHRYLERAQEGMLTADHPAYPDAVVLSLAELPALAREWLKEME